MRRAIFLTGLCALGALAPAAWAEPAPTVTFAEAQVLLPRARGCADVPCLIDRSYARDAKARALALALWHDRGDVAGVGEREVMDGGYRGTITLVPQLPTGGHEKHLRWTVDALRGFDEFFARLGGDRAPTYRWRGLRLRYVRSLAKRTPSAYAIDWSITYNVRGSLMTSAPRVAETLFHEIFHLNDAAHGDWSVRALAADYDAIVARCGVRSACLAPYAPGTTKVKATGTYYAFQPGNGESVREYGAELAVRYWHEQTEMLDRGALGRPAFKCGPAENARAWQALVDEFFAGRDLVPACAGR